MVERFQKPAAKGWLYFQLVLNRHDNLGNALLLVAGLPIQRDPRAPMKARLEEMVRHTENANTRACDMESRPSWQDSALRAWTNLWQNFRLLQCDGRRSTDRKR